VVSLMSIPLNLELLQSQARDYVITGSDSADVTRLNTPVLQLWSPLLVILAAGVIRLRPRWLWAVLLVPCLALQALSFNRSTWATLLVLAVIVAVLRGGRRGLLVRLGALVVIGAVALGALQAGVFGTGGQAVALRLTSVITGNALQEDSLSDRLQENEKAWATLTDSPVVGTGIGVAYGGESVTYDDVRSVRVVEDRPWIHNQYLRIWLWMGVLGLLAYGWVAVRLVTISWFDRLRRGRASTITVSGAAGLAAIAGQAVFATSLDNASVIITVALVLALIELSGAPPDADSDPDDGPTRRGPDRRATPPARPVGAWTNG
jgi:O-antigen ligase